MDPETSHFNRNLLIVLVLLFLVTHAVIVFPALASDPGEPEWWMVLTNMLLISIPLTLLYGSIYVLASAWREHHQTGQVGLRLAKIIHWVPRIASILIIGFIGMFSLDVFEIEASPLELLGGFLIHNIPAIAMILVLAFAWKRPVLGFAGFLIVAVLFAAFFVRDMFAVLNLLLFALPMLMIALLFYVDWKWLGAPLTPSAR
jgi:hypothetical protein